MTYQRLALVLSALALMTALSAGSSLAVVTYTANPQYAVEDDLVTPKPICPAAWGNGIKQSGLDQDGKIYVPAGVDVAFGLYYYNPATNELGSIVTDTDHWSDPVPYLDVLETNWDWGSGSSTTTGLYPSLTRQFQHSVTPYTLSWRLRDLSLFESVEQPSANDHPGLQTSEWDAQGSVTIITDSNPPATPVVNDGAVPGVDEDYTASTDTLSATWSSDDPESGIHHYSYAIGTSAGSNNVVNWTPVGTDTSMSKTGLSLVVGQKYYVSVKAWNRAGMVSLVGSSDGIECCSFSVERPLPTANVNTADRCNFRWSDTDSETACGDDFTPPAGTNWKVRAVRVWVVPALPVGGPPSNPPSPGYHLGDHFSAITLYGGPATSPSAVVSGSFTEGSDSIIVTTPGSSATVTAVPVVYRTGGNGQNYLGADGLEHQVWQIDFANLDWNVTGGTACIFGVHGEFRYDRQWFLHAQSFEQPQGGSDGKIWSFNTNLLGQPTQVDLNPQIDRQGWFGKGSDVSVQLFAHPQ